MLGLFFNISEKLFGLFAKHVGFEAKVLELRSIRLQHQEKTVLHLVTHPLPVSKLWL